MLKRITVQNLRLGMYLHEICGSWLEHPFWRTAFLLEEQKDLRDIIACGIHEVWIDTDKGLDVEGGQAQEESDATVEATLARADAPHALEKVSIGQEMAKAVRICAKAKTAVSFMFREARMGHALDTADALPLVEQISDSVMRNPGAIISLARLKTKDDYTYMHSVAVCALMVALSRQLGLSPDETRQAGMAGLLHDIGKMDIPPTILNKPGRLTDKEFDIVKSHPKAGHHMLLAGKGVDSVSLDVCLHHHEKMDGSGYPDRLSAEGISLFARMGAVCDVYDAITSDRVYKEGWQPAEALRKMAEWQKGHFDEAIFQAFVKSVGIYPVGSLVRLESGRLGVVVDQSEKSLLYPKVRVFFSARRHSFLPPELIDLSWPGCDDKVSGREDPAKWGFKDLDKLWRETKD
ncbi:MAG: HD-GYP domain-containing protein [Rhodocyclaceae bacterium]|nr:HD-GYP domain-containing protein [Rhodocyclaceae bacterium]